MKISVPAAGLDGAVGELARQAQLARRRLAADLLLALALQALLGLVDRPVEELRRLRGAVGEPMVEGVAHRALDDAGRLLRREPVLGLALELRLADEHGEHGGGRAQDVVGGDLGGAAVVGELAVGAQALRQRLAQAGLVRAAVGRGDGVAVGAQEAVLVGDPGDGPFDRAVPVGAGGAARERSPW